MTWEEFTDNDGRKLLYLLYKYMKNYAPDLPIHVPALAADLAMSQDVTDDLSDEYRREIEEEWNV